MQTMTVVVTGAAGYVGEMLCDVLSRREDVAAIVAIDKSPQTDFLKALPKVVYIEQNLADAGWETRVLPYSPSVVVHAAWQIRSLYGQAKEQWRWNIGGTTRVFDFAFSSPSVKTIIHFSTAASYSARADNTFTHYYSESELLRDDDYLYALEKKVSEELLQERYRAQSASAKQCGVVVLRPAAITGPRGRYIKTRFGLQSAVVGNLRGGFLARMVTLLTAFMPATAGFARQFVHEDDVVDTVMHFAMSAPVGYEVYNLTPEGEPLRARDMARAVGKRVLWLWPVMVRFAFWLFWHGTRGRIPTAPGSWRFYAYPLLMSGAKLTRVRPCRFSVRDAFMYTDGRYEALLPKAVRRSKGS